MEKEIFSNIEILDVINEKFILTNLYVDDRRLLPSEDWRVSSRNKDTLKTNGAINNDLQITKTQTEVQPKMFIYDIEKNYFQPYSGKLLESDSVLKWIKDN